MALANLHLMKIYLFALKIFIVKGGFALDDENLELILIMFCSN